MGYVYNQPTRVIEVHTGTANPITVTNVAADQNIGVFAAVPFQQYSGRAPFFSQLYVQINGCYDTSGAANNLNVTEIQINDGSWNSVTSTAQCLFLAANQKVCANIALGSPANVVAYLLDDTVQWVRFHNISSAGNNLVITSAKAILKMYFD